MQPIFVEVYVRELSTRNKRRLPIQFDLSFLTNLCGIRQILAYEEEIYVEVNWLEPFF
jgi:hypothetical protein